jgi:hypothetical protein
MPDNTQVPIRIIGSQQGFYDQDLGEEAQITDVVRQRVLPTREGEYLRVDVKVRRTPQGQPDHLVTYLLRKDIYLAEVVRVDVDRDYEVTGMEEDYVEDVPEEPPEGDWDEESPVEFIAPSADAADESLDLAEGGYGLEFVAATPVPEVPTAKAAVMALHNLATSVGLRSTYLLGPGASVAAYKSHLTSGLKGFVNIGHGNTSSIILSDGALPASWFSAQPANALAPTVAYFNSCQVFNDPLRRAVMKAGARTYIGGIVNLAIGPSEDVCRCFWDRVLGGRPSPRMKPALTNCEKDKYPTQGAHGLAGDEGVMGAVDYRLAQAMWTHGNGGLVEYPDRMTSIRRIGPALRLTGKPFTTNWIHFQIPTPVIVDQRRLRTDSVLLRFRSGPGASVSAIHVWDGERRLVAQDGLNLSKRQIGGVRILVPYWPRVLWGLGLSVGVTFGDDAGLPADGLGMDIFAAGGDFALTT